MKKSNKKIGFIIINYNDYESTKKLLWNIKDYKCLDLIVVVDNNSTDDSFNKLKKLKTLSNKNIDFIKTNENGGYAKGLNFGARYALKKLKKANLIFSNSDIIVNSEDDIKKLSSDINNHGIGIGVVGPTIVERDKLNRGWKMPSVNDEIKANLPLISRYFNKSRYYSDDYYKGHNSFVSVVSGSFFMVDGDLLKDIDFFDENTFLYYEENIFSKKIEKTHRKVAVDNDVRVIHNHSVTIDKNFKRVEKYKELKKSQRYFVSEYLDASGFQLFLLDATNKLSLFVLHIRNLFRRDVK